MKNITIISGFSGVGKGTVVKELSNIIPDIWVSVSDTTRPKRNEMDNYNFISRQEFMERAQAGYYLEYNEYGKQYYGSPAEPVLKAVENGKTVILEIDINGGHQVIKDCRTEGIEVITVFIAAEAKVLAQRLKGRGDSMDDIRRRLQIAAVESGSLQNYDYVLINNEVKQTAMQLADIICGNPIEIEPFDVEQFGENVKKVLISLDENKTL